MALFCVLLLIACIYDYTTRRIPNLLLGVLLTAVVLYNLWNEGIAVTVIGIGSGCLVILAGYPLFRLGMLGAGDVKLMGICAGLLPAEKVLAFLFVSMLISALISMVHFVRNRDFRERMCYLVSYLAEICTTRQWRQYITDCEMQRKSSICLAGPVLGSLLLYWGGMY